MPMPYPTLCPTFFKKLQKKKKEDDRSFLRATAYYLGGGSLGDDVTVMSDLFLPLRYHRQLLLAQTFQGGMRRSSHMFQVLQTSL